MKKGFTLVEILVVATIIGILATIGVTTYGQFSKQSRDAKRKADLEMMRAAVEQYRADQGSYPASISWGGQLCDPGGCSNGTYIRPIPSDPKTGYSYYYTGSSGDYTLGASLESGGTGSCGTCGSGGTCNWCVGPYGNK